MAKLDLPDIQGFVLSSYTKNMPCANYVLLKITEVARCRNWLNAIAEQITTGVDRKDDFCLNIAFTANAFLQLGFTADKMKTFSVPFREGMSTLNRQQILGDEGVEDWLWGNAKNPVDVLLLVFAKDEDELKLRLAWIDQGINEIGGLDVVAQLPAGRQTDTREHFGFLDGVGHL